LEELISNLFPRTPVLIECELDESIADDVEEVLRLLDDVFKNSFNSGYDLVVVEEMAAVVDDFGI
jgi:hypothetical protein